MNIKKLSSAIAGIAIIISTLACNIGARNPPVGGPPAQPPISITGEATTGAENIPAAGGACSNPYIPIIIGAIWNYKLTGTISDTYTHSIIAADGTSFTEQDIYGTGDTREGKWNCDKGNLVALDPTGSSSANVSAKGISFKTTSQSGITFPADLVPGNNWSQSVTLEGTETISGTSIPAKNEATTSCTAAGKESVTVAAGTFDAMRVDCQITMTITITMQGNSIPTTVNVNSNTWYTANIGMVKSVSSGTNFNSAVELTSYSIP